MHRFFRFLVVSWLCSILVAGGCQREVPPRFRIAVIPKGTTHAFWKAIHAGALKAAAEYNEGKEDNEKVKIIWQGPSREGKREEQQNIVQRFTSMKVDAIVLAPTDRESLVAPVEEAIEKDIPIVIIDSGLKNTPTIQNSKHYLGYVATDNYKGGQLAAQHMVKLLKGKGKAKVLMLTYQANSESTEMREKGFAEEIKKHADAIELIVPPEEAGDTVDTAQKSSEIVLTRYKDLDGIFTPNESSTVGMMRALEGQEGRDPVKLVGFDGSPELIDGLRSGKIHGLVLQDPFQMGYQSTKRAIAALEGNPPDPDELTFHTNLAVATRDNLEEADIRAMYSPDLSAVE